MQTRKRGLVVRRFSSQMTRFAHMQPSLLKRGARALAVLALLVVGGSVGVGTADGASTLLRIDPSPRGPLPVAEPVEAPAPAAGGEAVTAPAPPAAAPSGEAPGGSALAGTVNEVGAALSTCTPVFGSFAVGNWPPACWHPYGPSSPFNRPIPLNPTLSLESVAITKYIRGHGWTFQNDGTGNLLLPAQGSRPVYWSRSTDPVIKVICRGGFLCVTGLKIRIPVKAQPQAATDGHMTVVDQELGREYDFWEASKPEHGEMLVSAASNIPIGAGTGTGLGGAAEAADLGLLGGLLRAPELAAGKIEHALAITVKCVQRSDVWPAPAWGEGDTVCPYERPGPHLGTLLQLNMGEEEIARSGAPPWQQAIMTAMAHYGMYVVDTNGPRERQMHMIKEDDLSFTSFGYAGAMTAFMTGVGGTTQLVGVPVPVAKLRVIDPCVPRGTC
jgi:hypothetical protein